MSDSRASLRDDAGRIHQVARGADDAVSVGGAEVRVRAAADGSVVIDSAGMRLAWAASEGDLRWVFIDGEVFTFEVVRAVARPASRSAAEGPVTAPMPATVRTVSVAPGDIVTRGDLLVVLEAMKMELPIRAPDDGEVAAVTCREGELVQAGQELVRVTCSRRE